MKRYVPREFYNKLGVKGLAGLTDEKNTEAYLRFLKKKLGNRKKILDCACGYGRLTIPLAKAGYQMRGIDVSEEVVLGARLQSEKYGLGITIDLGDMRNMPYQDQSFDAVICMWSSYNELLHTDSQIEALQEMFRVTTPNGIIIIDVPQITIQSRWFGPDTTAKQIETILHRQSQTINGLEHVYFAHTLHTLENRLRRAGASQAEIRQVTIGETKRIVATIQIGSPSTPIIARPVEPCDVPLIWEWINSKQRRKFFTFPPCHEQFIAVMDSYFACKVATSYIIEFDDKPIFLFNFGRRIIDHEYLAPLIPDPETAIEIDFVVGNEAYVGDLRIEQAIQLLIKPIFDRTNIERIVIISNTESSYHFKCLCNLGFKVIQTAPNSSKVLMLYEK